MATWTLEEALEFATSSATCACDLGDDATIGDLAYSIASHRENVRDTLEEFRAYRYEDDAFHTFDVAVNRELRIRGLRMVDHCVVPL